MAPGIPVAGDTSQAVPHIEYGRVVERVGIIDRSVLQSLVHRIAAARVDDVPPEIGLAVQAVHECVAAEQALPVVEIVVDLELDAILRLRNSSLGDEIVLLGKWQPRTVRLRII